LEHHQKGTFFSSGGRKLNLNRHEPFSYNEDYNRESDDFSGGLIYDPKVLLSRYDHNQPDYIDYDDEPEKFIAKLQGKTKKELIEEKGAWQLMLTEDLPDLPDRGRIINGRHRLESNRTPIEYLQFLQTDPQYQGEQGFNLESWLTLAITYLHNQNIQIDDIQDPHLAGIPGPGKECFLIASCLKDFGRVLSICYFEDTSDPNYSRVALSIVDAKYDSEGSSTRTRVEI
jgi:hypothetical protein